MAMITKKKYNILYGPTTGDRIRLADTELFLEIERDLLGTNYGEEAVFGAGKVIRAGMGQSSISNSKGAMDSVITNVVIIDHWGIVKADIGIKNGRISQIGIAGNPDIQPNVNIIIGPETDIIAGEGMLVTAGAVDTQVHFSGPQQLEEALMSGVTTLLGGGIGSTTGSIGGGATSGAWNLIQMLRAADAFPINLGFLGKGNSLDSLALESQITGGAMGLRLHDDWGVTTEVINSALGVAAEHTIPVSLQCDSLNESMNVEGTIAALEAKKYTVQACVSDGHSPDILRLINSQYVIPTSYLTNLPYTSNSIDESLGMTMMIHNLRTALPEDVALAKSRILSESLSAQEILHDMGAISLVSSGSIRIGEMILRSWQIANRMKVLRGALPGDSSRNDNIRIKRYLAKYTINPALANGISKNVGSIEIGKLADLVLWKPAFFGVKPSIILKNGVAVAAQLGDSGASLPNLQPVYARSQFSAFGGTLRNSSIFLSQAALNSNIARTLHLIKQPLSVDTNNVSKSNMIHNTYTPNMEVDLQTFEVRADGMFLTNPPALTLSLAQRYFLF